MTNQEILDILAAELAARENRILELEENVRGMGVGFDEERQRLTNEIARLNSELSALSSGDLAQITAQRDTALARIAALNASIDAAQAQ